VAPAVQVRSELLQGVLGQAPIGGDLAAEDGEQGRLPRRGVEVEDIVPRRLLRGARAVVVEGTNPRECPDHVLRAHGIAEIRAGSGAEVGDLGRARAHRVRRAGMILVGGADQREIALVGNGEHDAPVAVLEDVGPVVPVEARHHDMASPDEAHARRRVPAGDLREDPCDPGARRIDESARPCVPHGAVIRAGVEMPEVADPSRRGHAGPGPDVGATLGRVLRVQDHQAGILDPAIGIFEPARGVAQGEPRLVPGQVEAAGRRQGSAPAEMIVDEQTEAQQPGRPQAGRVGQDEA
jgi:hypothetical protein